jgi:dTDP-glucose pyrophosphorylase
MTPLPAPQPRLIGTQQVLESYDIPAPSYRVGDLEIESTIDELLDRAVEIGEAISQGNLIWKGTAAPYAHQACTAYHAIEAIRQLQAEVKRLEARLDEVQPAQRISE